MSVAAARASVVYGHTPVPESEWLNRAINIDTGCVSCGKLTALRYPERELVSVPAASGLLPEICSTCYESPSGPVIGRADLTMKRKRHTPEQIIRKLREADRSLSEGKDIALVCQSLEVSEATFHRWRNQYDGMKANEARRLKELEIENRRLKKAVADPILDKQILEEASKGNW